MGCADWPGSGAELSSLAGDLSWRRGNWAPAQVSGFVWGPSLKGSSGFHTHGNLHGLLKLFWKLVDFCKAGSRNYAFLQLGKALLKIKESLGFALFGEAWPAQPPSSYVIF